MFVEKDELIIQGSKLRKSSGHLLATYWRNIVARCKFLVASLYIANDAAYNIRASDIYSTGMRNSGKSAKSCESH